MKNNIWRWVLVSVLLAAVIGLKAERVHADIAPPQQPPGSNISPDGETTQVQMVNERVVINVQMGLLEYDGNQYDGVRDYAVVTCHFLMRNHGSTDERLKVRFPLAEPYGMGDGWGNQPEIGDLRIKVDGAAREYHRELMPNDFDTFTGELIPWAVFDVSFPAGKEVEIDLAYTSKASGYRPLAEFKYILETGKGWKDDIETAEIVVNMPYDASPENVLLDYSTTGGEFSGREVRWTLTDLEPVYTDNFMVTVVEPYLWQRVLDAKADVAARPNVGGAWGGLARSLKHVALGQKGWPRQDEAGMGLFSQSMEAYEKAIALSPDNSVWYSGYAELLWADAGFLAYAGDPKILRIVQLLGTAIKLDPADPQALELLESLSYAYPDAVERLEPGYDLLLLTATLPPPTLTPTDITIIEETPTPVASKTPRPTRTEVLQESTSTQAEPAQPAQPASDQDVPEETEGNGGRRMCASIWLAPLAFGTIIMLKRKRR